MRCYDECKTVAREALPFVLSENSEYLCGYWPLPHLQLLQLMSDMISICRSYLQSAVMFNFEVKKYFTRGNIIQPSPSICSVCKLLDCEVSIGFGSVFRKKEVRPTLSCIVSVRLVAIFAGIRFLVKVWWSPGDYNNWQLAASTGPLTYHHLQAGGHIAKLCPLGNFFWWDIVGRSYNHLHHWASTQTWNIDIIILLAVLSNDC